MQKSGVSVEAEVWIAGGGSHENLENSELYLFGLCLVWRGT